MVSYGSAMRGNEVARRAWIALLWLFIGIGIAGCGSQKDFDPKALSKGDSPEIQQSNKSMEDFMKTESKSKAKAK